MTKIVNVTEFIEGKPLTQVIKQLEDQTGVFIDWERLYPQSDHIEFFHPKDGKVIASATLKGDIITQFKEGITFL